MPLYVVFVDFSKVFDSVGRDGRWKLLRKFGYPAKFVTIVKQFHEGMKGKVSIGGEVSGEFSIGHGVKQECVLATTFFTLFLAGVLSTSFYTTFKHNNIPITSLDRGKLYY